MPLLLIAALAGAAPAPQAGEAELGDPPGAAELGLSEDRRAARTYAISFGYAGATVAYGFGSWWQGEEKSSFWVRREGWFGRNTYRGGADKFGHMYSTYVSTRLLAGALRWAGNPAPEALQRAAALTGGVTLLIEIIDGHTEEFGFSFEDLAMDAAGIGLGAALETHPALDDLLDFRIRYWPSADAREQNVEDPSQDYSGQTYLLVLKGSGIAALERHPLTRYLELAVGYGSRGYKPERLREQRARFLYTGISLNLSRLLDDTVFRRRSTPSTAQSITRGVLEYIQIPETALLHRKAL